MAYMDPVEAYEDFKKKTVDKLQTFFPVVGKAQTLELVKMDVAEKGHPDAVHDQLRAKLRGELWGENLYGTFRLKDNASGKVVDTRRVRVTQIPRMTRRYSYIVGGNEYQVDNQWQLRQGVYVRRDAKGMPKAQFNVQNGNNFEMRLDPSTQLLSVKWHNAKLPAYPLLALMGISDGQMSHALGAKVLEVNKQARGAKNVIDKIYKSEMGKAPLNREESEAYVRELLGKSELDPGVTNHTLGKPFAYVTGDALLHASRKLFQVHAGAPEDDIDALIFKRLRTTSDFAVDKIRANAAGINAKMRKQIDGATTVRDVVRFSHFTPIIAKAFTQNQASQIAKQINPLEMVSAAMQTTVMGPGGMTNDNQVSQGTKFINPTHFGFLDPLNTPEGGRSGVSLRLPFGVQHVNGVPHLPLYDMQEKKTKLVAIEDAVRHNVALPDQVTWEGGAPKGGKIVKILGRNNEMFEGKLSDARYVLKHPAQVFGVTTNLIPFLHSTQGNRSGMAARHLEQTTSLVRRDVPLVQSGTGFGGEIDTFEKLVGRQTSHTSPIDGTVVAVGKDSMRLRAKDGTEHTAQLYRHFPVTDAKSFLHSTPLVGVGDAVRRGQPIADHNYSKDGHIALGKTLRVGYLPLKGYNFEDGIVISEKAAREMTSQHMHKELYELPAGARTDPKLFAGLHPGTYTKQQLDAMPEDGVVRVGQRVMPGDPLVLASVPFDAKRGAGLNAIRKTLSGAHTDKSLRWGSDFAGKVTAVERKGNTVRVHVHTEEPLRVGDKLCYDRETEVLTRSGWKPVADVTLDDEVCCYDDGDIRYLSPTATHAYPTGGRMYRILSQQVDLFVTEAHKMLVQPRGHDHFSLVEAGELFGKRVRYRKDGIWGGVDPEYFTIPALRVAAGQGGAGVRELPEIRMSPDTYAMLLGAYLSNGSSFWDESCGNYGIKIDKASGPQADELMETLRSKNIPFCPADHGTCTSIILYSKQLALHFKRFGHAGDKYIPEEVLGWSQKTLKVLLRWLMWGDGHKEQGRYANYSTISRKLADGVQRLCLHVGYAANVYVKAEEGFQPIRGEMCWCQRSYHVAILTKKLRPQVNHGHVHQQNIQQEYFLDDYTGPVYCVTVPTGVLYVRRNGKPVWSGNSGRHGNKGVVTMILPDNEMPRNKGGEPIDVALNPSGVPGRINVGQIYETVGGKIAQKTGKPYIVHNFSGQDQLQQLKADAKRHKVSDTEELFDPKTGHSLGRVTTGPLYMLKLIHQVEKQGAVRSGMTLPGEEPETYDENLQPRGGGHAGGQRFGSLGVYGLLAHGAVANLREAQTLKGEGMENPAWKPDPNFKWKSNHREAWEAIQLGMPLPPPQPTFAFKKFEAYLRGAGINMEKKGHNLVLSPLTDKQILKMSSGELKHPDLRTTYADDGEGNPKPIAGGLFDPKTTGGHGGKHWTHIKLAEPMPNPVFEKPIRSLLGLTGPEMRDIVHGKRAVGPDGRIMQDTSKGLTGGMAIEHMLGRIDVEKELERTHSALSGAPAKKLDALVSKVKYLKALQQAGMGASEAYVLHYLPILPPIMRPVSFNKRGRLDEADMNTLYAKFGQANKQLGNPITQTQMTDSLKAPLRESIYDGVKALMGVGLAYPDKEKPKGLLHQIAGPVPKEGMFQKMLLSKRQDLSMRAAIVPEPSLGLDEVGLPEHYAKKLFRPFVVKKMVEFGYAQTPFEAQKMMAENHPTARKALEAAMVDHPVLLKRDPALHKYSIQGFNPVLTSGKALKIHPLVVGGFNADFDGDRMAAFLPITTEAIEEARRMRPSDNLFSDATGRLTYLPTLEASLGVYKLGRIGAQTTHKVKKYSEAIRMAQTGKIGINDVLDVGGVRTTAGRILISSALPQPLQHGVLAGTDPLNTKNVATLLSRVGKEHKGEFGVVANKLKDLGNGASYGLVPILKPELRTEADLDKKHAVIPIGAHTLNLSDFEPDRRLRDGVIRSAQKRVDAIRKNGKLTGTEQDARVFEEWMKADKFIGQAHSRKAEKNPTNLFTMKASGIKPGDAQYKQLVLSPMIVNDSQNKPVLTPIKKSYSEGLDLGEYWTGAYGARRGLVRKVQEVQKPGVMTKELQNVSMDQMIVGADCGTHNSVMMPATDRNIHDRYLAKPFSAGTMSLPVGTLLTPDIVGKIRQVKKDAQLPVRSPLRCAHTNGICQKCYGLSASGGMPQIGTNVGVIAAHSLGERTTQLTLKEFHCLHEHTTLVTRQDGVVQHTTLFELFRDTAGTKSVVDGEEIIVPSEHLEVWSKNDWTVIRKISRHVQHPGTAMVLARTRIGRFLVSQDNHPHMLRDNSAVCTECRTVPSRSNGGKQFYCKKCGYRWVGMPPDDAETVEVEPARIIDRSHRATHIDPPPVTPSTPPVRDAWLCGMYCAEGWVQVANGTAVGVGYGQNHGSTRQRLEAALAVEYPEQHQSLSPRGVTLYNGALGREYWHNFGRYSRNVGLPTGWSGYPDEWLFDFLAGVVDGDGTWGDEEEAQWKRATINTTSLKLAEQIRFILQKIGVCARLNLTTHRKLTAHQGFAVSFAVSDVLKTALKASSKLQSVRGNPALAPEPRFADVVDYVRPVYFARPPLVYDIETGCSTFCGNGLWTHNSGGVSTGTTQVSSAFERLNNLLGLRRELPHQATIAGVSGRIDKIDSTGTGSNVWVNGVKHFVGKDVAGRSLMHGNTPGWQPPKVGLQVKPGQPLSDPARSTINPRHLYQATGSLPALQQHMVSELDDLFHSEGVSKKHHEVIVRAMTGVARVSDPGGSEGILRGEISGVGRLQEENARLQAAGKAPVRFAPHLQGIAELPYSMREDWAAKLMHRRLRDTIVDAASKGAVSNLHGNHPVPGLVYGAEFGRNVAVAKQPGMERFKNVPKHSY